MASRFEGSNTQQSPTRLSRSPHPYHRRSQELPDRIWSVSRPLTLGEPVVSSPTDYFSPRSFDRRSSHLTSASDSGTEADDEKPLLKALTAPPLRPRKGLRDDTQQGDDSIISPIPTPSLDESHGSEGVAHTVKRSKDRKGPEKLARKKALPQQHTRRKAAIARRLVEIILLVLVGVLTAVQHSSATRLALALHLTFVLSLYGIGLLYFSLAGRRELLRLTADVAPFLYPLLIPILVALALPEDGSRIQANLVLGLCSIPIWAFPFRDANIHWLLCLMPQMYNIAVRKTTGTSLSTAALDLDRLILLPPLHFSLLQCLEFLTTTSLLPTEVQLLSTALINLMLFADSPQTYILKALLWIGGLAVFCSCRSILRWTVGLARVPKWRFRKVNRKKFRDNRVFAAVDDTLNGWLSSISPQSSERGVESDSEDEDHLRIRLRRLRLTQELSRKNNPRSAISAATHTPPRASIDDIGHRQGGASLEGHIGRHSRSYTLPTAPSALPDLPQIRRTATKGLARFRDQPKYYVSLTSAQAAVLKWLYAGTVYGIILLTIMLPIRLYISSRALNGYEPFGWALGYLFGNLPYFRFRTVLWRLDSWICLPPFRFSDDLDHGFAEHLRLDILGPANTRLLICAYCLVIITGGIAVVMYLSSMAEVDTRRKVFHGMMVAMFGVTSFIDPSLISLAFTLILAIFLLLDLFRAAQLPPLSKPLTIFLAPYVDGRDFKGPVVVSHLFLLTGCAVPFWLALAALPTAGTGALAGWEVPTRDLSMVAGVVCVGMGDAAASLVGRRFGRKRWAWGGGKSVEGSLAFAAAVSVGLLASHAYLLVGGWPLVQHNGWLATTAKTVIASCAASLTEAVLTGANDNVLVPVVLWLWVKALAL